MIVFFGVVFGFYFLLLIFLMRGWRLALRFSKHKRVESKSISIVVAVRNEEKNIERLLVSIKNQSIDKNNFEILIVDDHSDDNTYSIVIGWNDKLNINVVQLNEAIGKKAALAKGIASARGELIVTTDADCIVPIDWLERINEKFQNEKINMLVGLVAIDDNDGGFFSKLQSFEFASVIGTGVATIGLGYPTMCNGANLSFRKNIFEEVNGYTGNDHIASGDDEFLMRKINNRFPNSLGVIDSVVTTQAQPSLKDFIQQRLRWASKWKHNSSVVSRSLAVFIFIIQLACLALFIEVIFKPVLIPVLIIKLILDFIFIIQVTHHLKIKFQILPSLLLQLIYPFYVLYIGILSQMKSHQWKGRIF